MEGIPTGLVSLSPTEFEFHVITSTRPHACMRACRGKGLSEEGASPPSKMGSSRDVPASTLQPPPPRRQGRTSGALDPTDLKYVFKDLDLTIHT